MYPAGTQSPGSLTRKQPSSGPSKPQQLLLLVTVVALHLVTGHGAADRHNHICADSQTLASALLTKDVQDVRIAGTVRVDPRHFRSAAAVTSGRHLRIATADGERPGVLDFGGTSDVLFVGDGGTMAFERVTMAGFAPANGRGSPIADSVFWPSVQLAPGATISFDSVLLRYQRGQEYADCGAYQASLTAKLAGRYGSTVEVQKSGALLLAAAGTVSTQLQLDSYGQIIGAATLVARNTTFICAHEGEVCDDRGCNDESLLAAGWRWVRVVLRSEIISAVLGTAFAVMAVSVCWLLAARTRREKVHSTALAAAHEALAAAQQTASEAGGTASLSSLSRRSSQRLQRTSSEMLSPPSSRGRSLDGSGPSRLPLSPGVAGQRDRQQVSDLLGDQHHRLMRMRLEGLDGIEVGPSLGRGSYGRVYKGRWNGVLIAVKVVEHTGEQEGGRADIVEGARESLLAASVSHPNVIPCYKICTVAIRRQRESTDADGFPRQRDGGTNSGSNTRTTASVVSSDRALAVIAANKAASTRSSSEIQSISDYNGPGTRSTIGPLSADGMLDSPVAGGRSSLGGSGGLLQHAHSASSGETEQLAELLYSSDPMRGRARANRHGRSASMEDFRPARVEVVDDPALHIPAAAEVASDTQESIEMWMLLEYADKGNLEQAIQQRRFALRSDPSQLDMVSVCRSLLDVAKGLEYLHSLGIVHGDLKPANVLLKSTTADPRGFICKLADFGLSRMLDLNKTHVSTQTYGTLPFMPVELLSEGHMGKSADVYSFAVVMWSLLTGDQPHHGMNTMQVLFNVVNKGMRPPVPDALPAPYRRLMEACWAQRAEDRPTVQQLNRELSALLEVEVAARRQAAFRDRIGSPGSASGSTRSDSGSEAAGRIPGLLNIPGRLEAQTGDVPMVLSPHAVAAAAAAARLRAPPPGAAGGPQRPDRMPAALSPSQPHSVPSPIPEEEDVAASAPARLPTQPAALQPPAPTADAAAANAPPAVAPQQGTAFQPSTHAAAGVPERRAD